MTAFEPGALVTHRPSEQRMRIERRVRSHFRDGTDAYWCTWRTMAGTTRRAMYSADELERLPSAEEPRPQRNARTPDAHGIVKRIAVDAFEEIDP